MKVKLFFSFSLLVLFASSILSADDPAPAPPPAAACCSSAKVDAKNEAAPEEKLSPKEILATADAARGNLGGVTWTVEISEGEDGKDVRVIEVKARGFDMLATTLSPAKQKNHKLLQVQNNMWFRTPNNSKPLPIAKQAKLNGQAANGDIASTNYAENYEVLEMAEEDLNGTPCFRFELSATSKNVTYAYVSYWVSKEKLVGIYAEYFTPNKRKKLKVAEMKYDNLIEIEGKESPFISEMLIRDTLSKDFTRMRFSDPKLGDISPREISLQALRR
ncbi:MAG: outer membrane lipoprotein-sorting protein [Opitutales bacterium]